ncbi:MAG: SlyX family protein [Rhodocyclaceae bacterium]|nr:SlyX family protein [Rhodocyclaceae bacterium]
MMEARVTELEVKLAFAEDLLDTLNRMVFRQQERIELLERTVRDLRQLVLQSLPTEQRSLSDELPPHY